MKIRKYFFPWALTAVCAFLPMLTFGQSDEDKINIFTDYAQFRASGDYSYVELYYAIPRNVLGHKMSGEAYSAQFQMTVQLFDGDSLLTTKTWSNTDRAASPEMIKAGQVYTTLTAFYLKEGEYLARSYLETQTKIQETETALLLKVRPIPKDTLATSDIELAMQIVPVKDKGPFVKNGYKVVPNPQRIFGYSLPELTYYCELYNFSKLASGKEDSYSVVLSVKDDTYAVVKRLPKVRRKRRGDALVEVGTMDVSDLRSGAYMMTILITDDMTGAQAQAERGFYVYHPAELAQKGGDAEQVEKTEVDEFSFMSEEQLNHHFDLYRYIATKDEKRLFKDLDLDGKRSFMSEFWKKRDPDPFTKESEYKVEYMSRVARANGRYTIGKKEGWRSDRGRVLILYGQPDDIVTEPMTMSSRGYEIWYYRDNRGDNQFVFVDLSRMGDMRLIHSTEPSETKNYEWRNLIFK